jgi:hypothetical protein
LASLIFDLRGAAEITSIGFADNCFGGTATAFTAFEVSAQKGLF